MVIQNRASVVTKQPLSIVRKVLQGYADRGVFRAFTEVPSRNGMAEFKFLWFPITKERFTLIYTDRTRALTFKRLLRCMPAKSEMYSELKSFIKDKSSPDLPEHRRVDPERAEVRCSNRLGSVSVTVIIKGNEYEYGVRKAVNLVSDLFMDLLHESSYYEYMAENFDMPEE